MSRCVQFLLIAVISFLFFADSATMNAASPGYLEGHLKIITLKEVEPTDQTESNEISENYAEFPLVVLSQDTKKEIATVTADRKGNYWLALQPGKYLLDAQRRAKGHQRAKPQAFTIVSNQTSRVNMEIDTGVR